MEFQAYPIDPAGMVAGAGPLPPRNNAGVECRVFGAQGR